MRRRFASLAQYVVDYVDLQHTLKRKKSRFREPSCRALN
jgi:hypothetical protein